MPYNVDWPNAEHHEVLPRLYIGGHVWLEDGNFRDCRHSTVSEDRSWNYVVSCYLEDCPSTIPRCDTRMVLFDDTEKGLDEDTWERISRVVSVVCFYWRTGGKVLIRCQAGYNRSGMLMCLVLMKLGLTAEEAIRLVRKRRGRSVLINPVFEWYVREREVEYRRPEILASTKETVGDLTDLLK